MIKLTKITINKRKDITVATKPTHDLVASDDNYENKKVVGALWTRVTQDKEGNDYKFLSGQFSKGRTHEGIEYDGYVLITEKEFIEYQSLKSKSLVVPTIQLDIPSNGEANPEDLPF